MSYYYEDPGHNNYSYEYANYGNHGNGDYRYKDDSDSDHNKPDQYKPNHTISEPKCHNYEPDHSNPDPTELDHHHYKHNNVLNPTKYGKNSNCEDETEVDWETNNGAYKNNEENRVRGPKHKTREEEYENSEVERMEKEVHELEYRAQKPY
jgi:hypothetical protein